MNPIVVIATHNRVEITSTNIRHLQAYGLKVAVVSSDKAEGEEFARIGATVQIKPNKPLGAKMQAGVALARSLNAEPLIICGSDDFLSIEFIKNIIPQSEKYDFIGLRAWFVYHENILYHFEYLAKDNLPLGGGRIYSKPFLDTHSWQIFDTSANKLLDDLGWKLAKNSNYLLINSPEILAIKGSWPVMNKFTEKHPNIKLVAKWGTMAKKIMKEKFNYNA